MRNTTKNPQSIANQLSKARYRNAIGAFKVAALSLPGLFIARLLLFLRMREEAGDRARAWNVSLVSKSKIDHHCQLCRRWSQHSCHTSRKGEGVTECPQREWLSETAFSLSRHPFLSPTSGITLVRWRVLCSRLGNPGGILFNIYIYIYMSNGDRPSASLVKGQERERER